MLKYGDHMGPLLYYIRGCYRVGNDSLLSWHVRERVTFHVTTDGRREFEQSLRVAMPESTRSLYVYPRDQSVSKHISQPVFVVRALLGGMFTTITEC